MRATTNSYSGTTLRARLLAAAIALAGSGVMVGANLGIAEYYAANAGAAESRLASDVRMTRQYVQTSRADCPS